MKYLKIKYIAILIVLFPVSVFVMYSKTPKGFDLDEVAASIPSELIDGRIACPNTKRLYFINVDGSGLTLITESRLTGTYPVWIQLDDRTPSKCDSLIVKRVLDSICTGLRYGDRLLCCFSSNIPNICVQPLYSLRAGILLFKKKLIWYNWRKHSGYVGSQCGGPGITGTVYDVAVIDVLLFGIG